MLQIFWRTLYKVNVQSPEEIQAKAYERSLSTFNGRAALLWVIINAPFKFKPCMGIMNLQI